MAYQKYPRTFHLPWSQGVASDDRVLRSVAQFEGKQVVVTEKMDGENTTLYSDHLHARSLDSRGGEDRAWVKQFWARVRNDIPNGWRICGENLWARHSISYTELQSYFYGFSIWDENNVALSWEETQAYFELIGVCSVPVLYQGVWDEKVIRSLEKAMDFSRTEGYVVRLADSFAYADFGQSVAKFVRKGHVQPGKHWRLSEIQANSLSV